MAARTHDGDTVAIFAPFQWDEGYEYAYARALYPLAGRHVVTFDLRNRANYVAAYRVTPLLPDFVIVWRGPDGALLRRVR